MKIKLITWYFLKYYKYIMEMIWLALKWYWSAYLLSIMNFMYVCFLRDFENATHFRLFNINFNLRSIQIFRPIIIAQIKEKRLNALYIWTWNTVFQLVQKNLNYSVDLNKTENSNPYISSRKKFSVKERKRSIKINSNTYATFETKNSKH